MKELVSIKNAVNKALDYVGALSEDDVPVLIEWAIDADKSIGSYYDYEAKIWVLDVVNCQADLPCGVVKVVGLLLGDHGCDCSLLFDSDVFSLLDTSTDVETTTGFLAVDVITAEQVCCRLSSSGIRWQVQDNKIVLAGNYDGNKVTIKVLQYKFDSEGFPMININNVRAIASYLEYRLAARSRWAKDRREKMDVVDVRRLEQRWYDLKIDAAAQSAMPSESEQQEVADMYNNPLSGGGMDIPEIDH